MPHTQRAFRLKVARIPGQPQHQHLFEQRLLNGKEKIHKTESAKIFADLLKRQARRIMQDVTVCQPDTIAAHIARLDDLREIFGHVLRHDFKETAEARLSDFPLNSTYTLADFLEAMNHTRQTHRCPAFVNWRDAELARIFDSISTLAGHIRGLNNENLCPSCRINLAESEAQNG